VRASLLCRSLRALGRTMRTGLLEQARNVPTYPSPSPARPGDVSFGARRISLYKGSIAIIPNSPRRRPTDLLPSVLRRSHADIGLQKVHALKFPASHRLFAVAARVR
jgi:hypothetical protein